MNEYCNGEKLEAVRQTSVNKQTRRRLLRQTGHPDPTDDRVSRSIGCDRVIINLKHSSVYPFCDS